MNQIQIINLGLGLISQRTIESLEENSVQADAANNVWEASVKECLRGNNWSFAAVVDALAVVANYTPPFNFQYGYAYPSNAMAVWRLSNAYTDPNNVKGEDFRELYVPSLSAKVIVTNCYQAYADYTFNIEDPNMFDAAFVTALSYRLAAAMAMPLNADSELAANMTKIFANQMSEAQRQSSYENNVNNGESPTAIIDARVSGNSGQGTSIGGVTFDQFNRSS